MLGVALLLVLSVFPVGQSGCVGFCPSNQNVAAFMPMSSCDPTDECKVCNHPEETCKESLTELLKVPSDVECPGPTLGPTILPHQDSKSEIYIKLMIIICTNTLSE